MLDKAVAILQAVGEQPQPLGELSQRTGIPRPTAHRLAVALESHAMLQRDPLGRFSIGPGVRALAASQPDPLAQSAGPVLERLRDRTGESCQVYRRHGAERICIASAERVSGLRDTVPTGSVLPMTAGSAAQVLLAWDNAAEADPILSQASFPAATLAAVRDRGWAASVAEREPGVASVSAPIRDPAGAVIAAISVSGPVERLGPDPGALFAADVRTAAEALTPAV